MTNPAQTLALINMPGGWEWIILLVLGLLIFGRRLPEVGRSLGRGIVEFKKGIKGIEDEVEDASSKNAARATPPALDEQRTVARAPAPGMAPMSETTPVERAG